MGYLTSVHNYDDISNLKRAMLFGTTLASFNVEDFSTRRLENLSRAALDARFVEFVDSLQVPHGMSRARGTLLLEARR